jgi:hypothetical protein
LFDAILGAERVFAKLIRRQFVNQPMPIGVAGGLMPSFGDPPNQVRVAIGHPSENEEGALYLALVEQIQNTFGVAFDATGK